MVAKTYTLHLMHQSLNVFYADNLILNDVEWALETVQPDMISWGEMGGIHPDVRALCRTHGYTVVFFPNNQAEGFALKNGTVRLKSRGNILVDTDSDVSADRHVNWVQVKLGDETVWYHTGHWIPKNKQLVPGGVRRHNLMTHQMVAQVRKHAQGTDLSFFSGDINIDDEGSGRVDYNKIIRDGGLLSVWDEFKVYPGTMHRGGATIDVIGTYNRDKRVKALRYRLHPKRNSDHRSVSVWYEIQRARVAQPGGTGSGGGTAPTPPGPDPVQDDFYATGGDINWDDYFDGAIYNLPFAVEDSDSQSERFGVSE